MIKNITILLIIILIIIVIVSGFVRKEREHFNQPKTVTLTSQPITIKSDTSTVMKQFNIPPLSLPSDYNDNNLISYDIIIYCDKPVGTAVNANFNLNIGKFVFNLSTSSTKAIRGFYSKINKLNTANNGAITGKAEVIGTTTLTNCYYKLIIRYTPSSVVVNPPAPPAPPAQPSVPSVPPAQPPVSSAPPAPPSSSVSPQVPSDILIQLNNKEPSINLGSVPFALANNSSGKIMTSTTPYDKLAYLNNLTSDIQSQLNGKEPEINLGNTQYVLINNSSGKVITSSTPMDKLSNINNTSGDIQAQINDINNKVNQISSNITNISITTPAAQAGGSIINIFAGGDNSIILYGSGTFGKALICGNNDKGQLSQGTFNNTEIKYTVPICALFNNKCYTDIVRVACGINHSLFIDKNNNVLACGFNNFGQLGIGTTTNKYFMDYVLDSVTGSRLADISEVACNYTHSMFLEKSGKVLLCGDNSKGQLAQGSYTNDSNCYKPRYATRYGGTGVTTVYYIQNVKQVACGYQFSAFLETTGKVLMCGENKYGVLGQSDNIENLYNSGRYVKIGTGNIAKIVCGDNNILFLENGGKVLQCGDYVERAYYRDIAYFNPSYVKNNNIEDTIKNIEANTTEDIVVYMDKTQIIYKKKAVGYYYIPLSPDNSWELPAGNNVLDYKANNFDVTVTGEYLYGTRSYSCQEVWEQVCTMQGRWDCIQFEERRACGNCTGGNVDDNKGYVSHIYKSSSVPPISQIRSTLESKFPKEINSNSGGTCPSTYQTHSFRYVTGSEKYDVAKDGVRIYYGTNIAAVPTSQQLKWTPSVIEYFMNSVVQTLTPKNIKMIDINIITKTAGYNIPEYIINAVNITDIAASKNHYALLENTGAVLTYGSDTSVLGNDKPVKTLNYVLDLGGADKNSKLSGITKIVCGSEHTLLLSKDNLYSFGKNTNGQLGIGSRTDSKYPTIVSI